MARDNPRSLPPTRTLRRIRWPLQPRSRDRRTAFRQCWRPLNDVLTSSWVSAGPSRFQERRGGRLSSHRFARRFHRRSHADDRASLGPRSLLPPPFFERCVRAYSGPGCCLPTSATLKHDVRTLSSGLSFPRRDGGHDHLPFLTRHARPPLVSQRSGDARQAAHSSADQDPVAGSLPLAWVCPTAIPRPTRHLPRCGFHRSERVQWRLTCTGLWTE